VSPGGTRRGSPKPVLRRSGSAHSTGSFRVLVSGSATPLSPAAARAEISAAALAQIDGTGAMSVHNVYSIVSALPVVQLSDQDHRAADWERDRLGGAGAPPPRRGRMMRALRRMSGLAPTEHDASAAAEHEGRMADALGAAYELAGSSPPLADGEAALVFRAALAAREESARRASELVAAAHDDARAGDSAPASVAGSSGGGSLALEHSALEAASGLQDAPLSDSEERGERERERRGSSFALALPALPSGDTGGTLSELPFEAPEDAPAPQWDDADDAAAAVAAAAGIASRPRGRAQTAQVQLAKESDREAEAGSDAIDAHNPFLGSSLIATVVNSPFAAAVLSHGISRGGAPRLAPGSGSPRAVALRKATETAGSGWAPPQPARARPPVHGGSVGAGVALAMRGRAMTVDAVVPAAVPVSDRASRAQRLASNKGAAPPSPPLESALGVEVVRNPLRRM
jgi:hypothetical protein